jgi:hypothetical protein
MKLYATREFARAARKLKVRDAALAEAVRRAEAGLIDADLGAHLYKQRVARDGQGRSGGYRTIVYLKEGDRAVFLHIFEKSRKADLSETERDMYRAFARLLASLTDAAFAILVEQRQWRRIDHDEP